MRRFIYLDTETLNSYIAQIYDGLITSNEENKQYTNEINKEFSHSVSPNANIDFKVFNKGIEGKIEYIFKSLKADKESAFVNKVETKLLHDNAFDLLISHINEYTGFKGEYIGNFIEIFDSFYILDFLYYKELFSDENFINFIVDSAMENIIKEAENKKAKLTTGTSGKKQIIKDIDNNIATIRKKQISEYMNTLKIIEIITKIQPYHRIHRLDACNVTL